MPTSPARLMDRSSTHRDLSSSLKLLVAAVACACVAACSAPRASRAPSAHLPPPPPAAAPVADGSDKSRLVQILRNRSTMITAATRQAVRGTAHLAGSAGRATMGAIPKDMHFFDRSGASGTISEISCLNLCWPVYGTITRGFDPRIDHKGLDIKAPPGTPIVAAADGRVVYAGKGLQGFGNVVVLDHGGGVSTIYGHNRINCVRNGQSVRKGSKIAEVGQTGNATTPHCHFEIVCNRGSVDPAHYLQ